MDAQSISEYVVKELMRYHKRDDIIATLCEKTGRSWSEIEPIVRRIEQDNKGKLQGRHKPLLLIIGAVSFFLGIGLSVGIVIATLDGLIIWFWALPIPDLPNFLIFIFGLGMAIGGARGLIDLLYPRRGASRQEP